MNSASDLRNWWRLTAISILLLAVTGIPPSTYAQPAMLDPVQMVQVTVRDALAEVLNNEELYRNNGDRLQAMVEERIAPYFNFERMTQLAVAQPWRDATPAQRESLTREFRSLLIRTYANVSYDFRSDLPNIRITPRDIREQRALVRVEVDASRGRRGTVIDIRMEKRDQRWQVIDVMVDGVSLIVNYRASFASEIARNGFDGLIETLKAENSRH
ncbi:MAG: ABC transporter substrate-binding protein [Gammaproteobacteria bacterium]|nr:ABC transporter substrate-binding protein [Pseudomonadales bacterium]MCP5348991.1 ABC transporter substrate-binding protein [Pseudomonadales bacterium]